MNSSQIRSQLNKAIALLDDFKKLYDKTSALSNGMKTVRSTLDKASNGYISSFMIDGNKVDYGATERLSKEVEAEGNKLEGEVLNAINQEIIKLEREIQRLQRELEQAMAREREEAIKNMSSPNWGKSFR